MRPSTFLVGALAALPSVMAVDQMKNVIVWAEDVGISENVIEKAKNAIIDAGGKVTHVYTLIRCVPQTHGNVSSGSQRATILTRQLGASTPWHPPRSSTRSRLSTLA